VHEEQQFIWRRVNQLRPDFAAIEGDLDLIKSQIARLPTAERLGLHCARPHQPSCPDNNLTPAGKVIIGPT
jgi:hypothetical protein